MKWILDTTISSATQLGAHILNDHEFTCSVTDNTFNNQKTVICKAIGGGPVTVCSQSGESLEKYLLSGASIDDCIFEFVAHVPIEKSNCIVEENQDYVVANVPISILARYLTRWEMRQIAAIHGIVMSKKLNRIRIMDVVGQHTSCETCSSYLSVFLCKHGQGSSFDKKGAAYYLSRGPIRKNIHSIIVVKQSIYPRKEKKSIYVVTKSNKKRVGLGKLLVMFLIQPNFLIPLHLIMSAIQKNSNIKS